MSRRFQSAIDVANTLALIEGNTLDWRLVSDPDKRSWKKNENNTLYEFTVDNNGRCECYKTVGAGQRRRVSEGCKESISEAQIQQFLGSH